MLIYTTLWFIINHNTYFRLPPVYWQSYFTRYCSDIFKVTFANLSLSLSVKEFLKSVNIWRSYGQEFSVLFFIDWRCINVSCWLIAGSDSVHGGYDKLISRAWKTGKRTIGRRYCTEKNDFFLGIFQRVSGFHHCLFWLLLFFCVFFHCLGLLS